jgi:large subunit ribosomal protein L29
MNNLGGSMLNLLDKDSDGLYRMLIDCKRDLFNLRFQQAVGDLKNTSRIRFVKRNIARVNTELSKRDL